MLEDYDYNLPANLIAKEPSEPRDGSRLFVYDTETDQIDFDIFRNLGTYLPKNSLLVFNETKVVPARINLKKQSGGKAEALFLFNELLPSSDIVQVMLDRKVSEGEELTFEADYGKRFLVVGQEKQVFTLKPNFPLSELGDILFRYGRMPIPKYIKGTKLEESELQKKYQTIFANRPSSVAAPTASLHFTKEVFEDFAKRGISTTFINLQVGLGTFAPISSDNFEKGKLHREIYDISARSADMIREAKEKRTPIIAVGTTVTRALESGAKDILSGKGGSSGSTEIFIRPPYEFQIVDKLITNFHIPKSSLMMLVEAFLQNKKSKKKLVELYKIAIKEKFRFYSFGDAMLIK